MHVLVTGASGYFGRLLLPALLQDPTIERVVGIDRLAPPAAYGAHPRYHHVSLDLAHATTHGWEGLLRGVDLVYHFAFVMAARPGEDPRPTNLHGQAVFLEAALGVARRVIVASAVAAYGFAPGRDVERGMLLEDAGFAPHPGIAYAEHKQALERLLGLLAARSPATLVIARPTNVVGPGIPLERAPLLIAPAVFAPYASHPLRQQMLYEEDLTRAMLHLTTVPAGAYNIGPADWFTLEEAAALLGKRCVHLPGWVLRGMADVAWRAGQSAFDASWLLFFEQPPIIISSAKLVATGWQPRFGSLDALMLLAGHHLARRG